MTRRHEGVVGEITALGRHIRVRAHALDRYIERVKPAMDYDQAIVDLQRLAGVCGQYSGPPDWMRGEWIGGGLPASIELWLCFGDDIAFALLPSVDGGALAVTCVTRGGISDQAKAGRRARRAQRVKVAEQSRGRSHEHRAKVAARHWKDEQWAA